MKHKKNKSQPSGVAQLSDWDALMERLKVICKDLTKTGGFTIRISDLLAVVSQKQYRIIARRLVKAYDAGKETGFAKVVNRVRRATNDFLDGIVTIPDVYLGCV